MAEAAEKNTETQVDLMDLVSICDKDCIEYFTKKKMEKNTH